MRSTTIESYMSLSSCGDTAAKSYANLYSLNRASRIGTRVPQPAGQSAVAQHSTRHILTRRANELSERHFPTAIHRGLGVFSYAAGGFGLRILWATGKAGGKDARDDAARSMHDNKYEIKVYRWGCCHLLDIRCALLYSTNVYRKRFCLELIAFRLGCIVLLHLKMCAKITIILS